MGSNLPCENSSYPMFAFCSFPAALRLTDMKVRAFRRSRCWQVRWSHNAWSWQISRLTTVSLSPLKPDELQVLRAQYEKEGPYVGIQTEFNYAWVSRKLKKEGRTSSSSYYRAWSSHRREESSRKAFGYCLRFSAMHQSEDENVCTTWRLEIISSETTQMLENTTISF